MFRFYNLGLFLHSVAFLAKLYIITDIFPTFLEHLSAASFLMNWKIIFINDSFDVVKKNRQ